MTQSHTINSSGVGDMGEEVEDKILARLPATFNQLQSQLMGDVPWRRIDAALQKLRRTNIIHYKKHGRHFLWHKGPSL